MFLSLCDETKDSQLYILAVETLAYRQCQYLVASRRVLERAKHEILSPQIFAIIILTMYVYCSAFLAAQSTGARGLQPVEHGLPLGTHSSPPFTISAATPCVVLRLDVRTVLLLCRIRVSRASPLVVAPPPCNTPPRIFPVRGSYHHAGILNPPTGVDCSISATTNGAQAHRETTPPERQTKRQGTAEANFAMRVSETAATAALCLAGAGGAAGFQSPWVVGRASSVAGAGAGVEQQRQRGAAVAPVPSAR